MNEHRLISLEENQVFLEQRLEKLHEALLGQQQQIDRLEALLQKQSLRLEEVMAEISSGPGPANEKPPHYL